MSNLPTTRDNLKPVLIYSSLAIALLLATSFLQRDIKDDVDVYYLLSSVLALGTGFLHVKMLHKTNSSGKWLNFWPGLGLSFLIVLISAGISAVYYQSSGLNPHFLTSQLHFIIPFMIDQVYLFYVRIPPEMYKLWYYPEDEQIPLIDMVNTSETQVLHFVLTKNPANEASTSFKIEVPLDMTVGDLFFNLIYNYNSTNGMGPIEYAGSNNELFGWLFYIESALKNREYADPDLTLKENKVEPGSFIYATRVFDKAIQHASVVVPGKMAKESAAGI
jgi:hypothetical protein